MQKYIAFPCRQRGRKKCPAVKLEESLKQEPKSGGWGGREKRDRELIFLLLSVLLLVGGFTGQYFLAFKGKHQNGEVIVR